MSSIFHAPLLVACLCADWCGACREYKPLFDTLSHKLPNVRFLWVDVEDQADVIDPTEVENFPTILIAKGEDVLFFGMVLPHIETLERLITAKNAESNSVNATPDGSTPALRLLVKRLMSA